MRAANSKLLGTKILELPKPFWVQTWKYLKTFIEVRTYLNSKFEFQVFPSLLESTLTHFLLFFGIIKRYVWISTKLFFQSIHKWLALFNRKHCHIIDLIWMISLHWLTWKESLRRTLVNLSSFGFFQVLELCNEFTWKGYGALVLRLADEVVEALFVTYDLWKWLLTVSRVALRHFWVLVKMF